MLKDGVDTFTSSIVGCIQDFEKEAEEKKKKLIADYEAVIYIYNR